MQSLNFHTLQQFRLSACLPAVRPVVARAPVFHTIILTTLGTLYFSFANYIVNHFHHCYLLNNTLPSDYTEYSMLVLHNVIPFDNR